MGYAARDHGTMGMRGRCPAADLSPEDREVER